MSFSPAVSIPARKLRFFRRGREPDQDIFNGYEGKYESYVNELHYAKQMAGIVGSEHHELLLTQDDLIDFVPRMCNCRTSRSPIPSAFRCITFRSWREITASLFVR